MAFLCSTLQGVFNFHQVQSICFAVEVKQELIRCLLSVVHVRPHLVARVMEHAAVVEIVLCASPATTSLSPVNAKDLFWALVNSTQRDPASPLAVEWSLLLLSLLLKPVDQSDAVLHARDVMVQRISQLKPSSTLRAQVKSIPGLHLPD